MAKFMYNGKQYSSKSKCIEEFGFVPKSVFEIISRENITLEQYLDRHLRKDKLSNREVLFNNVKYRSVREAFRKLGFTEDEYYRFMVIKKSMLDSGELKSKDDERALLDSIFRGDSDILKKSYGKHVVDGIEYNSIEKMVNSYGYTLEQYNIYKRYRKLKGNPVEIFEKMRNDDSFKENYSVEVKYKGKKYPSIRALTDDLGYEYTIFTSRMYLEGVHSPEEYLAGVDSGKYDKPLRKRNPIHNKISYHIGDKGFVTQEDMATYLGMAKVTLIHKAQQNNLSIEEMANVIYKEQQQDKLENDSKELTKELV